MKRSCHAILVSLVLVPLEARADNSLDPLADFADPKKLVVEGRALMRSGNYVDACPKLEQSIRLDTHLGAEFDLADCHDHIGKVVSAWTGFRKVASDASQPERRREATQRMLALEKKLPKLAIEVPSAGLGLEVRRDGVTVEQVDWGREIPVDPGEHRVTAWIPGGPRWLTIVESSEGATIHVQVPRDLGTAADKIAVGPPPPAPTAAPTVAAKPPPPVQLDLPVASKVTPGAATTAPAPSIVDKGFWTRTNVGLVVGGAGIAGLLTGAGFGLASLSSRGDAGENCRGNSCTVNSRDDAIHNGDAATVATVLGAVALTSALIMIFTEPKGAERVRASRESTPPR